MEDRSDCSGIPALHWSQILGENAPDARASRAGGVGLSSPNGSSPAASRNADYPASALSGFSQGSH